MPLEAVEARRLYRQIADQLRALIDSGEYRVGSRLPTERDLAEQLKVSRPTVREALIALGWKPAANAVFTAIDQGAQLIGNLAIKASRFHGFERHARSFPDDPLSDRFFLL